MSSEVQDFILRCLDKKKETRLGAKDSEEILNHKWFADLTEKGKPSQANHTLVKRLQQGHFLITEAQQFSCRGSNSCFMIENNKMMHLIADSSARTGMDLKLRFCIAPREGDTVMAYWDFARVQGQAALACAIFLAFPTGQIEIVCLQTRKVDIG